jgi:hypothetical protein
MKKHFFRTIQAEKMVGDSKLWLAYLASSFAFNSQT